MPRNTIFPVIRHKTLKFISFSIDVWLTCSLPLTPRPCDRYISRCPKQFAHVDCDSVFYFIFKPLFNAKLAWFDCFPIKYAFRVTFGIFSVQALNSDKSWRQPFNIADKLLIFLHSEGRSRVRINVRSWRDHNPERWNRNADRPLIFFLKKRL